MKILTIIASIFWVINFTACSSTSLKETGARKPANSTWEVNDFFSCYGAGVESARVHLNFIDAWQFRESPTLSVTYAGKSSPTDFVGGTLDAERSRQLRAQGLRQAWAVKDLQKNASLEFSDFSTLGSVLVGFNISLIRENELTKLNCGNDSVPNNIK